MKWPRGKYNGKRVVGFVVKARLDVTDFHFCTPTRHGRCLQLGWLKLWLEAAYH